MDYGGERLILTDLAAISAVSVVNRPPEEMT